jgi:hypothetical protein
VLLFVVLAFLLSKSRSIHVSAGIFDRPEVVAMRRELALAAGVNQAVVEVVVEHTIFFLGIYGLPKGPALTLCLHFVAVEFANNKGLVDLAESWQA